jgi:hypothetical protein
MNIIMLMRRSAPCIVVAAVAALAADVVRACPFCSAVSLTFAQEIAQSEAAVIARLVEPPPAGSLSPRAEGPLPKGKFAVVEVLKGADLVAAAGLSAPDGGTIETIMLEEKPVGTLFLLMGVEPPNLIWSSPVRVGDRAVEYLRALGDLPEKGPDRLAFFQEHLEDEDETLARDAYDEFAVAPYADVRGLGSRMDPIKLLAWIENPKVQANRRRLYATMLGVCGSKDDAARIGRILAGEGLSAEQLEARSGLDALIACYVALEGPPALDLVDRLFLDRSTADGTPREVPFTETYAAVMALRFLGEESDLVPRERVLASLRLLLQEPKLADLVIADLARWQDWSVIDRLVTLFKEAQADNIFVREPIVNYLRACPLPEAATAITELERIDPEAVRRAATLAGVAGLVASAAPSADDGDNAGPAAAANPTDTTKSPPADGLTIAPVLADDDATDDVPGRDVSKPEPSVEPSRTWKWIVWGAVVLAIALVSRAAMRPAPARDR